MEFHAVPHGDREKTASSTGRSPQNFRTDTIHPLQPDVWNQDWTGEDEWRGPELRDGERAVIGTSTSNCS
jgi:hypothetical protein